MTEGMCPYIPRFERTAVCFADLSVPALKSWLWWLMWFSCKTYNGSGSPLSLAQRSHCGAFLATHIHMKKK